MKDQLGGGLLLESERCCLHPVDVRLRPCNHLIVQIRSPVWALRLPEDEDAAGDFHHALQVTTQNISKAGQGLIMRLRTAHLYENHSGQ